MIKNRKFFSGIQTKFSFEPLAIPSRKISQQDKLIFEIGEFQERNRDKNKYLSFPETLSLIIKFRLCGMKLN